jgi:hypothetical protein
VSAHPASSMSNDPRSASHLISSIGVMRRNGTTLDHRPNSEPQCTQQKSQLTVSQVMTPSCASKYRFRHDRMINACHGPVLEVKVEACGHAPYLRPVGRSKAVIKFPRIRESENPSHPLIALSNIRRINDVALKHTDAGPSVKIIPYYSGRTHN